MKNFNFIFIATLFLWCTSVLSQEKLEEGGAMIIANSEDASPAPGTIRFNLSTNDFEGHNGIGWKSLTKSGGSTGIDERYEANQIEKFCNAKYSSRECIEKTYNKKGLRYLRALVY